MIRKIISAEEREDKEQRNRKIIVMVLGAIMLISSASYAFMSFEKSDSGEGTLEKKTYNGIDFLKTEYGTWKFNIQGYDFETRYNPEETFNVSINLLKNIQEYSGKTLYFGIDNSKELAVAANTEIIKNINPFLLKYQESCLTTNCTGNYPIKNCSIDNVLIFKEAEKSKITEENSCVIIEYNKDEEIMTADAFVFKLLGMR